MLKKNFAIIRFLYNKVVKNDNNRWQGVKRKNKRESKKRE